MKRDGTYIRPPKARGAALLSAMLTVTLVATLAAATLWQQWRSVEVESAERQRAQAYWVLTGALDWARLILREDGRTGGADHLGEPWAIPLAEARLSAFLAADKTTPADEAGALPDAFLAGEISDLQARLNVQNLVEGDKVSAPALNAFTRLYEQLALPKGELLALADQLLAAQRGDAALQPLLPQRLEELAWLGLSERSLAALRPHITLLPQRTPVNLNTASATVLYAAIAGISKAQAQRLASERQTGHFKTLDDAARTLGNGAPALSESMHGVSSRFFEVRGSLRLEGGTVQELSVVQRDGQNVQTLWRSRRPLQATERALQ